MKYEVDMWNNFCRVFLIPNDFPHDFCFIKGHPVNFQMVDWFNPVEGIGQAGISKEAWLEKYGNIETKEVDINELSSFLVPWLRKKLYINKESKYLILFDFGASITFNT